MSKTRLAGIDAASLKQALSPIAAALPSAQRAPVDLRSIDDFAAEIRRLWRESHERFILIGEYLEQAKERLSHGEFIAMVENYLPFGRGVAFQLMTATRAIKSGLVEADKVPPSYSTVYLITTLSEEEREKALSAGIIHSEMKRADLLAFKRSLTALTADRRIALQRERARLLKRLAEVEAALAGEIADTTPEFSATAEPSDA